jgi:arsenate reductase
VLRVGTGVGRALLLTRRALAEVVGTAFLVVVVVGSGIAAQRLSPGDVGLELLENAAATAGGLVALILALGPVSGAHFNPVVSLADAAFGGLPWREVPVYAIAQVTGAIGGAVVANLMFDLDAVTWSQHHRAAGGLWLGETVATIGLLLVIFGLVRSRRASAAPFAVGAYIGGAYFFTSSTSFANPAVTIGRAFTDTFAGIAPSSVPGFIACQLIGLVFAVALVRALYPDTDTEEAPLRDRNDDSAVARGRKPAVLFLCVHNAGRSQMAAGWLRHLAGNGVEVFSGGSEPAATINPTAVDAMAEVGIDITGARPHRWTDDDVRVADVVVTMGCGDSCPFVPGKRYEDWELTDPAGQPIEVVRAVRDDIRTRVEALIASLQLASA